MPESPEAGAGTDPAAAGTVLLAGQPLTAMLDLVMDVAVGALGPVWAASVSLAAASAPGYRTIGASDDSARALDQVQYGQGGGPCVEAMTTAREVDVVIPVDRWEEFSEAAAAAGYRSVRSLPLQVEELPTGSLNLYCRSASVWADHDTRMAHLLARQTAGVLATARDLARSEHASSTLRQALETRTVIGQAQGVIMARESITPEGAFDILRRASQRTNRKLRDIAAEIVAGVQQDRPPPG